MTKTGQYYRAPIAEHRKPRSSNLAINQVRKPAPTTTEPLLQLGLEPTAPPPRASNRRMPRGRAKIIDGPRGTRVLTVEPAPSEQKSGFDVWSYDRTDENHDFIPPGAPLELELESLDPNHLELSPVTKVHGPEPAPMLDTLTFPKPKKPAASNSRLERRRGKRRSTHEHVDIYVEGKFIDTCQLRDVSTDDAFVESDRLDFLVGARVDLYFPLPRKAKLNQKVMRMHSQVTRIAGDGFAVCFIRRQMASLRDIGTTVEV